MMVANTATWAEFFRPQAKEAVERMRARREEDKQKSMNPSDIWRQMEQAPTEEAMFACFNALSESKRLEVAEWVLTHVSMFKGRGPFSRNITTS